MQKKKNSNDELKSEYLEKTFYISREKNFYIYMTRPCTSFVV